MKNFPEINRRGESRETVNRERVSLSRNKEQRRGTFFFPKVSFLFFPRDNHFHSYIVSRSSLPPPSLPFFSLPTFTSRERLTDERTPPSNYYYIKRFPWLFAPLTNDGGARSSSPCTEPLANSKVITSLVLSTLAHNSLSLTVLRALPFSSPSSHPPPPKHRRVGRCAA